MRFGFSQWPTITGLILIGSLAVLALNVGARADKYPEPKPYQVAWQFQFTHSDPKRIVVNVPGTAHPVAYWYMTYTVRNPGDKTEKFVPAFDLLADDGTVTRGDLAIPPMVFDQIKRREGIKLLEESHHIEGDLNPGEDEAKDGVAIWPEPMPHMGSFSIFAGGLSGEYIEMKDTEGKVNKEHPNVLRKTFQMIYHIAGNEVKPGEDDDHPVNERWVMR